MDRLKRLLSRIIRLKIRKCKLNINVVLKREPTKSFSKRISLWNIKTFLSISVLFILIVHMCEVHKNNYGIVMDKSRTKNLYIGIYINCTMY